MRVLVVHNRYRSSLASGENAAVESQVAALRAAGLEVETFIRSSDEIDRYGVGGWARLAVRPVYSGEAVRAFRARLARSRPDVVHLHNVFPLISPWVVRVARSAGVPVVQSVHNYRLSCLSGLFFRDGQLCQACQGRRIPWPGVVHACYRGSRVQSVAMAAAHVVHRPTWRLVDHFLPVSGFVARQLEAEGIPRDRMTVVPAFVADPGPPSPPGRGFFFAGRLTAEKGVRLLLDAWRGLDGALGQPLVIAGDGPDRAVVEAAARSRPDLRYLGRVDTDELGRQMGATAVVVLPSVCHDAMSTVLIEAFARGRPVVGTALGGTTEALDEHVGWRVGADARSLAAGLAAAADREGAARKAVAARRRYETDFSPGAVLGRLVAAYRRARETAGWAAAGVS
jgi:glycosyltransferase involved in cell wall biosynthesis